MAVSQWIGGTDLPLHGVLAPPAGLLVAGDDLDRNINWVQPELIAEVRIAGWSGEGRSAIGFISGYGRDRSVLIPGGRSIEPPRQRGHSRLPTRPQNSLTSLPQAARRDVVRELTCELTFWLDDLEKRWTKSIRDQKRRQAAYLKAAAALP